MYPLSARKMAGKYPKKWAAYCDLSEGAVGSEQILTLIGKTMFLRKRLRGKRYPKYNLKIDEVYVCDLGMYCVIKVKMYTKKRIVLQQSLTTFEKEIKHLARTYLNIKPSFDYDFSLWATTMKK